MSRVYYQRHPERTALYRVLFHYFEQFLLKRQSIRHGFSRMGADKTKMLFFLDCIQKTKSTFKFGLKHKMKAFSAIFHLPNFYNETIYNLHFTLYYIY